MEHIAVSILLFLFTCLLCFIVDKLENHTIVDFIESRYGYEAAVLFRNNKIIIMLVLFVCIMLIGWIWVEFRSFHRVNSVLSALETGLLKEGEVHLDQRYQSVENAVNAMKLENLRHQQDAQREAERKNDLITYLAHDIRTPLASVIGYLSLLEETPDLPGDLRAKYVGITLQKANRLEELVDEFFDITRFNLSQIPLDKERIPLRFLLEQLAEEFYPVLKAAHKTIRMLVSHEQEIYADPDKIARVFANLLKNAAAYSYENTEIILQAQLVKGKQDANMYVLITVENEGREIAKEKLEQIFDKFFRLDGSRSTKTGGAGLGLAIAKEIVVQHGGQIYAESQNGHTKFSVILPYMTS